MITLILIEPEHPGNTGAILRAMKNFEFSSITLINPKFDINSEELKNRAKWAQDLIPKIKIKNYDMKKLRKEFDYLIATTAKIGRDYNILRSPISPEQLAETIHDKKSKIGILIGREGPGLNNDELRMCDFTVTIPTSKKYGTMNISHATTIILYEIFKKQKTENITSHIAPITAIEKEQIYKQLNKIFDEMNFTTNQRKETQKLLWQKIIGKSFLSKREAYALMGFLKKIK
ncbi:MAG: RNA methyltransferase [Candidatus Woesearchaeota archaeon]